jgi:hypothetical protein
MALKNIIGSKQLPVIKVEQLLTIPTYLRSRSPSSTIYAVIGRRVPFHVLSHVCQWNHRPLEVFVCKCEPSFLDTVPPDIYKDTCRRPFSLYSRHCLPYRFGTGKFYIHVVHVP